MLKVHWISLAILSSLMGSCLAGKGGSHTSAAKPSFGSTLPAPRRIRSSPRRRFRAGASSSGSKASTTRRSSRFIELEAKHPGMKGLAHELGAAYYKSGDFANAIFYLEESARREPEMTRRRNNCWACRITWLQRPAEAIPELEKVQTWFASANVDAAYILGICYIQTKDYPNARKAFAKMFDVPAESAASYLFTARMLLRQDFGPVAEEYAHKAVALDPKLPLAHQLLGELYLYHSQIDDAIAEFRKELEINPGNRHGVLQACGWLFTRAEIR